MEYDKIKVFYFKKIADCKIILNTIFISSAVSGYTDLNVVSLSKNIANITIHMVT